MGVGLLGALALVGWLLEKPALATLWPNAIPMAPSTALAFLATAWLLRLSPPAGRSRLARWGARGLMGVVLVVAVCALIPSAPLEERLRAWAGGGEFQGFPLAVMSHGTAGLFVVTHSALIARWAGDQRLWRQLAAAGGWLVAIAGWVVILGYLFRAPLFRLSDSVIPLAPTTGMCFAITGLGLVAASGSDTWPASGLLGGEVRHSLTRAFFPVTVAIVLLVAWAMAWILTSVRGHPAIGAALLMGLSLAVTAFVTSRVAESIGAVLRRSEQERSAAHAREALAKARADTILACVGEGICGVDASGRITFINPTGAELLSTDPERLRGEPHQALFHGDSPASASDCGICASLQTLGRQHSTEAVLRKSDGSTFPARLTSSPIREAGAVTGVVVAFSDLTEQKRLEQQLLQSQKMEAIGQLAGGVAHDFNNLLAVILSYSHLILSQKDMPTKARSDIEEIVNASNRAAQLTSRLLAFSRQQVLQPRVVELDDIVRNAERLISRLIGEDIELAVSLAPKLGKVRVDPVQIEQILMNLVVNSRDALPNGGRITIETSNVELDGDYAAEHLGTKPGRYVLLAVSDNGIGMDAVTRARLFEPFFTTKELGRGTGLGLSTVFGIVKQGNGHIWVYSEPGRGTTIKVYFPEVDAPTSALSEPKLPITGGHERILLVEDEPALQEAMLRVLKDAGYDVLAASDGVAALELVGDESIDLVVTDIVMPAMGGPELVQKLRERRPALRALYTSGYTDRAVVREALLEDDAFFLQKPFTPGRLKQKIRETLAADAPC